jgi:lysocardiolipin and lysophospholipid acyltransferase
MSTKTHQKMADKEMYTIPIADRPPHGPLYSKIFFPILFNFGQIGINSAQILALPLLLIPVFGRKWFDGIIGWTKDGYGRLCTHSYTSPFEAFIQEVMK